MDKLLLMSVIFATVLIPLWTSRHPSPRVGIKYTVILMLGFNFIYLVALLKLWPRLLWSG